HALLRGAHAAPAALRRRARPGQGGCGGPRRRIPARRPLRLASERHGRRAARRQADGARRPHRRRAPDRPLRHRSDRPAPPARARFCQGPAGAFTWTGGLAWLVAASPATRRGPLIGQAFAAAVVGALFGPVLGGIASLAGTGWTFGAVAAASLGLAGWAAATP